MSYTTEMKIGKELRRTLREFGDDGYDDARTVWNGAVDRLRAAKHWYDPDGTFTAIAALTA